MDQRVVGLNKEGLVQKLTEEETVRINNIVQVEVEWWKNHLIKSELDSLISGELVVVPEEGQNFRLIGNLRNGNEPRTLSPIALKFLNHVLDKCRDNFEADIDDVFLAVTSLYRLIELQRKIAETNPLAAKGFGAHCAGRAIDFDPNGYYLGGERKSIQTGNPNVTFNPIYRDTLAQILREFEAEGLCHIIFEKRYRVEGNHIVEYTACIHVCVSPEYK